MSDNRLYSVSGNEFFIKVRPYTGALGSGEGFLYFRGSLPPFLMGQVVSLAERACCFFSATGVSRGRGGPGVSLDEWFCAVSHSKEEVSFKARWENVLFVVLKGLLLSQHCVFEFLGSIGLRRRLDCCRFYGKRVLFLDTSCRWLVAEGMFDSFLVYRRMFIVVVAPLPSGADVVFLEAEKRFSSLSAELGSTSDVLYGEVLSFMDMVDSRYGLEMSLLSEKEVSFLKQRGS